MKARTWLTATALAVAVTSAAPAFVDGASAAPVADAGAASVTHTSDNGPTLGLGTAVTLHKVHGKVVHVHRHGHRHHHHKH